MMISTLACESLYSETSFAQRTSKAARAVLSRRIAQAGSPETKAENKPEKKPEIIPLNPLILSEEDQKIFDDMTLQQKVGQLFLIGFMGQKIEEGLGDMIREVRPGGLILFSRNIHEAPQVVKLVSDAQKIAIKASKVPLLVGVDQEGGNVIRIKTYLPLPSALAFGEAGQTKLVEDAGLATGQLLKVLGINMNFAPVLDVADPNKPSFIGTRTFGSDGILVGQMGASFADGMAQAGVLATGKHFPGHGGIDEDSHKETPEKLSTVEQLEASDLVPFVQMRKRFGDNWAVMLGHIAYPKIDASGLPATFSKPIVTGLLRDRIGFNGVVVTDDIEMGGAFIIKDVRERALRAVEAGADMVMIAWNKRLQRELSAALLDAVKEGRISEDRIDESVKRILIAKRRVAQPNTQAPTQEQLRLALKNPKFTEVAEKAMSARFARAPQKQERDFKEFASGKTLLLFSSNQRFSENFRRSLHAHSLKMFPLNPDHPELIDKAMRANPNAAGIFYVSGLQAAGIINRISGDVAKRILVVSVETQGALKNAAQFGYFADVYYRHPALGKMIADHYFGTDARLPAATQIPTAQTPTKLETYSSGSSSSSAGARPNPKLGLESSTP